MQKDLVISKLKLRIWWYIFFGVQFLLAIFMIGSLASDKWTKSDFYICSLDFDNDTLYSDSCNKFEGALFVCKEGCEDAYESEYKDLCDENSDTNSTLYGKIQLSFCSMFVGLYFGGLVMIGFEMISFISIIIWFSTMICSLKIKKCFWVTCCCSICSCIGHFIGIIVWFALSRANFKNECNIFPLDGSQPTLCAADGPSLGVFIMIIFPIVVGFYLFIGCKAYRNKEVVTDLNKQGENVKTNHNENINLNNCLSQFESGPEQRPKSNNFLEKQGGKNNTQIEMVEIPMSSNRPMLSFTITKGPNKNDPNQNFVFQFMPLSNSKK